MSDIFKKIARSTVDLGASLLKKGTKSLSKVALSAIDSRVSQSIDDQVTNVNGVLQKFSTAFPGLNLPNIPSVGSGSGIADIRSFVDASKNAFDKAKSEWTRHNSQVTNALFAVRDKKNPSQALDDLEAEVPNVSQQIAVRKAQGSLAAMESLTRETEMANTANDAGIQNTPQWTEERNFRSMGQKITEVGSQARRLTVFSELAPDGSLVSADTQMWRMSPEDIDLSVNIIFGDDGPEGGPDGQDHYKRSDTAVPSQPDADAFAAGDASVVGTFVMQLDNAAEVPLSRGSYDFDYLARLEVTASSAGPVQTPEIRKLNAYYRKASGWVKVASLPLYAAGTFRTQSALLRMPAVSDNIVSGSPLHVIQLVGEDINGDTFTLESSLKIMALVGKPKKAIGSITDVTYWDGAQYQSLSDGQTWESVFGVAEVGPFDDPNFGLIALWQKRIDLPSATISEVAGSIADYQKSNFNSDGTGIDIDTKYAYGGRGAASFVDACAFESYILKSGPLSGLNDRERREFIEAVTDELEFAEDSFQTDSIYAGDLIRSNAQIRTV
jgi:hypothetical protein